MKRSQLNLLFLMPAVIIVLHSCKAKKAVVESKPPVVETEKEGPVKENAVVTTEPKKEQNTRDVVEKEKPVTKFANIQFEFNSAVIKTFSYPILDEMAVNMKKNPSAKFVINGHSSAEGSPQHNQSLSVDRANSVKSYLVNAGIAVNNLAAIGHGESRPVADNKTETGKALNRRVEIVTAK